MTARLAIAGKSRSSISISTKPSAKPVSLIDVFEAEYDIIGNEGPVFYLKTTLDAPNKRVIAIDTRAPARSAWKEIVPAGKDAVQSVSLAAHQIFVTTLQDAQSAVAAYDLKGKKIRDVTLPGIGSVGGFGGLPDDRELFYGFTSFLTPGSVYRYDVKSGTSTLWKKASVPFDATAFETKQVFYPSKDGTKIPLFLIEKKGLALDGGNPVLLTGYGGFGHAQTPYFSSTNIAWLEQGGIVAIAGLRGGGEYGEAWHKAGTKTHKQVVFDDFIAAGEWLIANKYTSKEKLGVYGGSNGGLLIGAVVTQRPDLFAAAASLSGVLDMIRFPLFGQGAGWEGDYGSPEDEDELKALFAYSPVHNTHPGTHYPATLVVTADHDVRVAPLHSYKFAAALQAAQAGDAPVLLRVETTSGHGGGTTRIQPDRPAGRHARVLPPEPGRPAEVIFPVWRHTFRRPSDVHTKWSERESPWAVGKGMRSAERWSVWSASGSPSATSRTSSKRPSRRRSPLGSDERRGRSPALAHWRRSPQDRRSASARAARVVRAPRDPRRGTAAFRERFVRWAERALPAEGEEPRRTLEWMMREGEGEKLESIAESEQIPAPRVRKRVSRLRRHLRAEWRKEVALLAALGIVAMLIYLARRGPREPIAHDHVRPVPSEVAPSPQERARSVREDALAACGERAWAKCLDGLDRAKEIDPAGDTAERVVSARAAANAALNPPPAPIPPHSAVPVPSSVPMPAPSSMFTPTFAPTPSSTSTPVAPSPKPSRSGKASPASGSSL